MHQSRLALFMLLIVGMTTGCEYDRSFMRMDSNSGSPFLGFQLSVDASDAQKHPVSPRGRSTETDAELPDLARPVTGAGGTPASVAAVDEIDNQFSGARGWKLDSRHIATSEQSDQLPRVRMSLPEEEIPSAESTHRRLSMF